MPRTKKIVPAAKEDVGVEKPKAKNDKYIVLLEEKRMLDEKIKELEEEKRVLKEENRILTEKNINAPEDVLEPKGKKARVVGKPKGAVDTKASSSNADGKKGKAGTSAKKNAGNKPEKLRNPMNCVPECLPGPKSGCCQRSGKRLPGQMKCTEVVSLLKNLGIKDCSRVSKCMMSGLMSGAIKLPEGGDLDTVLYEFKGDECDHQFKITLRKLLYQPDYAGLDYEDGLQDATVFCESHGEGEEDCDVGRTYVTNLCQGKPNLDSGKFHNHCTGCPGFGRCLYDYRNQCRVNKKTGVHCNPRYVGSGGWLASDNESDEGRQDCSIS